MEYGYISIQEKETQVSESNFVDLVDENNNEKFLQPSGNFKPGKGIARPGKGIARPGKGIQTRKEKENKKRRLNEVEAALVQVIPTVSKEPDVRRAEASTSALKTGLPSGESFMPWSLRPIDIEPSSGPERQARVKKLTNMLLFGETVVPEYDDMCTVPDLLEKLPEDDDFVFLIPMQPPPRRVRVESVPEYLVNYDVTDPLGLKGK